jgi:hypothetical protein
MKVAVSYTYGKRWDWKCGGQHVDAKTDVCVMERSGTGAKYLLLVQEDKVRKLYLSVSKICLPITRAKHLNHSLLPRRWQRSTRTTAHRAAGLPKLQPRTFVGITMVGTTPTFYKIPVTDEIFISLATAQYPPKVTTVKKLVPPVPFPERLANNGMKPLVNKHIISQCFKAFRQFLVSYYSYITQMTGTTKFLYKNCSHGQKRKIRIFERPLPSNSPEIVHQTFRHSTLIVREDPSF